MLKYRDWVSKHSVLVAILIVTAAFLYFLYPTFGLDPAVKFGNAPARATTENAADFADMLSGTAQRALGIVVIVVLLGWFAKAGLSRNATFRQWLLIVPLVLLCGLLILVSSQAGDQSIELSSADWRNIGLAIVAAFFVGVFEETLFRGILLQGLRDAMPAIFAVIVSSIIFGSFHLVNWVGGQPLELTLTQVVSAAGGGLFYAALVLYTNSLWPSIIAHGIWDSTAGIIQTFAQKSSEAATDVATAAEQAGAPNPLTALLSPVTLYGVVLLIVWWWLEKKRRRAE